VWRDRYSAREFDDAGPRILNKGFAGIGNDSPSRQHCCGPAGGQPLRRGSREHLRSEVDYDLRHVACVARA